MQFRGRHGVDPAEKALAQRFEVDVELVRDLRTPGVTDEIGDTIDYADVYRFAQNVIEGPSRNLLEALAEEIARRIARYWTRHGIEQITVRVRKQDVPVEGAVLRAAAVEITRWPRIDYG